MLCESIILSAISVFLVSVTSWQLVRANRARKLAERETSESVRYEQERFRWIFENATMPMQTFAPNGKLLSANQAWLDLTQQTAQQMDEFRASYNVFADSYLDLLGFDELLENAFLQGQAGTSEAFVWHPPGTEKPQIKQWFKLVARPMTSASGEVREILLRFIDVTDRMEATLEAK